MAESAVPANPRLRLTVPDPEDRNSLGYERLLDAVLCLLVESGAHALAGGFKPDDVAKRAGKSRASYYRTEGFPAGDVQNHESRVAVLEAAIDRALRLSAEQISRTYDRVEHDISVGRVNKSPEESIRVGSVANFSVHHHAMMSTRLYAAALSPSSLPIEASLRQHYESISESIVMAYEQALRYWGYRPRQPFDTRRFVVSVLALSDGLVLRYLADPMIDAATYSEILAQVAVALLEPVPVDDAVGSPSTPTATSRTGAPPLTRAAVCAALQQLLDRQAGATPSLAALAAEAGCSEQTLLTHFGGVAGVVRSAWSEWTPGFEDVAARHLRELPDSDPIDVLRAVGVAVTQCSQEQPALVRALLACETGAGAVAGASRAEPVVRLFERLLTEAVLKGRFRAPEINNNAVLAGRNAMFARTLRDTLLTVAVNHPVPPGADAQAHSAWCVDYVWGLLVAAHVVGG